MILEDIRQVHTEVKLQSFGAKVPMASWTARFAAMYSLVRRIISSGEWLHDGADCGGTRDIAVVGNKRRLDLAVAKDLVKARLLHDVGLARISPAIDLKCTAANPAARAPPHPQKVFDLARFGSRRVQAHTAIGDNANGLNFLRGMGWSYLIRPLAIQKQDRW